MAQVWAAYTHTVHYLVDTDTESVEAIELPGWINTFGNPDVLWDDDGGHYSPSSDFADEIIDILETAEFPTELS